MKLVFIFGTLIPLIGSCSADQIGFYGNKPPPKEVELDAEPNDEISGDAAGNRKEEEKEEEEEEAVTIDQSFEGNSDDIPENQEFQTYEETIEIIETGIPTEIYLLVDTSASMNEEKAAVIANIQALTQELTSNGTELDYHLFIIQQFAPDSIADHPKVTLESGFYVGSNAALENYTQLFTTETQVGISSVIQPDPSKHHEIIVISDNNSHWTPEEFAAGVAKVGVEDYSLNAIVGLTKGEIIQNECKIDNIGQTYIDAAAASPTPGLILDLCNPDWNELLTELGRKIKKSIKTSVYPILKLPSVEAFSTKIVLDDNSELAADSFTLDRENKNIVFTSPDALGMSKSFTVHFYWK